MDDVAEGHILALEKGRAGEVYHLTGPALTLKEAVDLWAEVSGQRRPFFSIPSRFVKPLSPLVSALGNVLPLPEVVSPDTLAIIGATYLARPDKAIAELGWTRRPVELGFRETFETIDQAPPVLIVSAHHLQPAQDRGCGAGGSDRRPGCLDVAETAQ